MYRYGAVRCFAEKKYYYRTVRYSTVVYLRSFTEFGSTVKVQYGTRVPVILYRASIICSVPIFSHIAQTK